jgi:RNA polymerase sigma-70 factor, ECF subfamily
MEIERWLVAHGTKDAVMRMLRRFRRGTPWMQDIWGATLVRFGERGESVESIGSWMRTTALRIAINDIRRRVDIPLTVVEVADTAETLLIDHERRDQVLAAIGDLPARQRMAVLLRIVDEMSFADIASRMDCEYDTAKAHYRWGSLTLKERLWEK